VHTILRNRLCTGQFEWNGKLVQGTHEPLVPIELWERVQGVFDGRSPRMPSAAGTTSLFSGLIACHACGCAVVGEIKKERYVYYHCTGYADKCQVNPATCRRHYCARGSVGKAVHRTARAVKVRRRSAEWVRDALHASHADERREHEEAIKRHQAEYKRLQTASTRCMSTSSMASSMRRSSRKCRTSGARSRIAALARSSGTRAPTNPTWTRGVQLLELARNASGCRKAGAARKTPPAQFRFYRTAPWEEGEVVATFRQPFDMIAGNCD